MPDRGFDYERGSCQICGGALGLKRNTMRVPFFDPYLQGHQELAQYINRVTHQSCWDSWSAADTVARLSVEVKADEYDDGLTLAHGQFSGAWGYMRGEVDFSPSSLLFARSSMIYMDFGPYVGTCEVRGRTPNLAAIVHMVESDQLAPGFQHFIPSESGFPDLRVQCYDYENNRLEVAFTSSAERMGLDVTCFLRLDDLQDMRDSLKKGAAWREPPPRPQAIYPVGPVGGPIAEFREPDIGH